ncbi:FAD-dependent oxidoreductase [Nitrosophilus kaiyonis]|uniref:FAD-dependent oxidoreductase n=1 Tax=Nitrosophilus kaiyonis TaxID=2930200 RepID=UPI002490259D|nr:FAD-dependent oxidoreductase [Nitrosophilus kaiyonis]
MIYDFIIVGAGSAGAHCAYFLKKAGAKVLVVEQNSIASGASFAAGAFISPRLGRGGILQKVTNHAFSFSVDFYKKNFSQYFYQTGILRLPKDKEDAEKFSEYEKFIDVNYEKKSSNDLSFLKDYAKEFGGFFFKDGGVVDAVRICKTLLSDIEVKESCKVEKIEKKDDVFLVNDFKSKSVVLATGAWEDLNEDYISYGKVAGFRFDVNADLNLPCSIHKKISISKKINNKIIIGATHNRVEEVICPVKPNSYLLDEAKKMVEIKNVEITGMYCGVRPSIYDHLPVIGEVIDSKKTLEKFSKIKRGKKIDPKDFIKHKNLYIINGFGGRGFVFGPYISKRLVDFIIDKKEIEKELNIDRVFLRYMKKGREV